MEQTRRTITPCTGWDCKCALCRERNAYKKRVSRAKELGKTIPDPRPRELDPPIPYIPARWGDYAKCRGLDTEVFFSDIRGNSPRIDEAKRLCHGCQAKDDCLTYAIQRNEKWGIWGGLTTRQRRNLGNSRIELSTKLLRAQQQRDIWEQNQRRGRR